MGIRRRKHNRKTDRMSDVGFKLMTLMYKFVDFFYPFDKRVKMLNIKEGFTVIDYGCGPGRYIGRVSRLVGENGKVYAVDIHKLAIEEVKNKIKKYDLKNVEPVLTEGYNCKIRDNSADLIYALDMFHMINKPSELLNEFHRILKPNGTLIIEDGHQPRTETKRKINESKMWHIDKESKEHLKCSPIAKGGQE